MVSSLKLAKTMVAEMLTTLNSRYEKAIVLSVFLTHFLMLYYIKHYHYFLYNFIEYKVHND